MLSLELLMRICGIEALLLILAAVALVCGHALWLWREQRWSWPQLTRGWAILAAALDGPVPPPADLKWLGSLPVRLQIRLFTSFGGGREYMPTLLRDPHPLVRAQAAEWAVEHPHLGIINSLLTLLDDGHALCRVKAQDSLLRMGRVVKEPLHRYLISHPDNGVEAALRVAVGLPDQRFLPVAIHLCQDASPG